jgi:hypothetical protein
VTAKRSRRGTDLTLFHALSIAMFVTGPIAFAVTSEPACSICDVRQNAGIVIHNHIWVNASHVIVSSAPQIIERFVGLCQ